MGASHQDGYLGIHGLEYQEDKEDGKRQEFSMNLHNIIQTGVHGTWWLSAGDPFSFVCTEVNPTKGVDVQ